MLLPASLLAAAPVSAAAAVASADKTTKYRVYQNNQLLYEVSDLKQAQTLARGFTSSHVEEIGSRRWIWDNFPRYRVYQYDATLPEWQFATLDQAVAEAKKWGHASVRDLQNPGWVWNNYPRYRLYQGEITTDGWEFATLADAKAEAKKWGNAHIIDLTTNEWVWDNIPDATKNELRAGPVTYRVYQGDTTLDAWAFASLEDAVREALRWSNSTVVNVQLKQTVFDNRKNYQVYQNDNLLDSFVSLDAAADFARRWAHSRIVWNGKPIWTNTPYYQVLQNGNPIGEFTTIPASLSYAAGYANVSIKTLDGTVIWDNIRKLQYWGWNGSSSGATIRSQVSATAGMDVDSPSYFQLADADGNLKDASDPATVDWLSKQGFAAYPLVSNQFDSDLTTKFLANAKAQDKFIQALVARLAAIGASGVNIDFESMNGKDRAAFTAFVKNLTDAAHAKGLAVSVDLPRGSVKWNHLSAYDHEKLGDIVDYIVIMAYDQYFKGSTSPGSVSGLQWTEDGIKEFLSYGIRRDKIILGIPYYVREWKLDASGALVDNRAVLLKDIPALIAAKGATQTWDAAFGQYRVDYSEGGYKYVFWLENVDTVKARIELAKKYELAGVSAWRLGYETPDLWTAMLQQK
ncbi:glycoside hydrolase family 18 [Gordoniibacillus kamchatkensis]|uniref:Glycoside hydrolase family 18 n=2 Tax=Gordoniibacillus kamchatkensis TaxID=1590651 RepID=A0ABR5AFC1_9BACL|nr:glycoside hydrolase family 18 [Paenibacillus sp. VKM B-2647]